MSATATVAPATEQPWRRALTLLGLLGMLLALLAVFAPPQAAYAACKPGGVPNAAGASVAGLLDGPTKDPSGGNNYGEYGWAGLKWYTCDLGVTGDIGAEIDTNIGNGLMGLAVWEGAAINGMHKWTADPTATLKPIDDKIVDLSDVTKSIVFDDWAYPVIVIAAAGIMVAAFTRKARAALMTILATFLAIGFMTAIGSYPLDIAKSADGVASSIVSKADEATLKVANVPSKQEGKGKDGDIYANTDEATGAVLNDAILAPMWRLGQTGTTKWYDTTQKMFTTSTLSYKEVHDKVDDDKKKEDYNDAFADAKTKHPEQYTYMKGQGGNRPAAGLFALLLMTSVAAIRIPAEALIFLGLLVFRFIPVIGPLFALFAINEQTRGAAIAGLKTVAAAIYNVIVFGIVAALETAVIAMLFVNSSNLFVNLVVSAITTYLLLKISKPFRSVTRLATGNQVAEELAGAPEGPGNLAKRGLGFIGSTASSYLGNTFSRNHDEKKRKEAAEKGTISPETEHPGPDVQSEKTVASTQVHPDWQNPPNINAAWSDAPETREAYPAFTPENKWTGLDLTSPDWDEPLYYPNVGESESLSSDTYGPDRGNALVEPEWDDSGRMVDSIFIAPNDPATNDAATNEAIPATVNVSSSTTNNQYNDAAAPSGEFFTADQINPERDF